LDDGGDLLLKHEGGQLRLRKPVVYQEAAGDVAGTYRLREDGLVGFDVERYDPSEPLVIDPVLSYSSYAGGDGQDATSAVSVAPDGSTYLTGSTSSLNFPTANPWQGSFAGGTPFGGDVIVMKLSPDGTEVVYSTYIGGSAMEAGADIAVDTDGNAYVTGAVRSADFPVVGALQPMLLGAGDVFVLKLDAAGSALVYSTYMGGSSWETGNAIAVGDDGRAYVAGQTHSTDFPVWRAL
ncbi:MAG: hypothetical protein GY953_24225, partial [bacterium]|nr:hypothetical protein [bacterium]